MQATAGGDVADAVLASWQEPGEMGDGTLVEIMAAHPNLAGLPRERYLRAVRMAQREPAP